MAWRKARTFRRPKKDGIYRCPGCGCHHYNACQTIDGTCYWMPDGWCSACHGPSIRDDGELDF